VATALHRGGGSEGVVRIISIGSEDVGTSGREEVERIIIIAGGRRGTSARAVRLARLATLMADRALPRAPAAAPPGL
jgi:hypothetical protein